MNISPNIWEVIKDGASDWTRVRGMSDDQRDNEWGAQKRIIAAILDFRAAINLVNESSSLVKIDRQAFEDFIHDEMPSTISWDEKISEARRG